MIVVYFFNILANLLIAGFTIRTIQRTWPDAGISKALASVY